MEFPSLKGRELLAVLKRLPLEYAIDHQKGSHRKLKSPHGYPNLGFSFHDGVTIPPRVVREVLVDDVGLSQEEALKLL